MAAITASMVAGLRAKTGAPMLVCKKALTEAEGRVARLVASGLTNKGIAEQLSLSHHTVDAHLKHTFTKLGIHSRVELTVVALRRARGRRAR